MVGDGDRADPAASASLLRSFGASTLGGVLDELGLDGLITGLRAVEPGHSFAGPAFTVKMVAGERGSFPPADFDIAAYIDAAPAGSVIAIDLGGRPISTMGGIAALAAQRRGVAGVLVDGGVRDGDEIAGLGFPVFVRHLVPVSGRTRVKLLGTRMPVTIDGVLVHPGDQLVGDRTGVVRLPKDRIEEITARARAVHERDERARAAVLEGCSFAEAFRRATTAKGG
jgi:regulator of RNase E activity RraA